MAMVAVMMVPVVEAHNIAPPVIVAAGMTPPVIMATGMTPSVVVAQGMTNDMPCDMMGISMVGICPSLSRAATDR